MYCCERSKSDQNRCFGIISKGLTLCFIIININRRLCANIQKLIMNANQKLHAGIFVFVKFGYGNLLILSLFSTKAEAIFG